MATKTQVTFYKKKLLVHLTKVRRKTSWDKTSPQKWTWQRWSKSSSTGHLLHLDELKEQILGDGLREDVVDAKIMSIGPLMVIIWWWRGIIRMYFAVGILLYNSIINHVKYISAISFPNNIKGFNKICIMCGCHIMKKTMNLSPNLMKNLRNYEKKLRRIWNIIIYVIQKIKYHRYGVSISEWIHRKRRVSNQITIAIERTWKVWRIDIWTMCGKRSPDISQVNLNIKSDIFDVWNSTNTCMLFDENSFFFHR